MLKLLDLIAGSGWEQRALLAAVCCAAVLSLSTCAKAQKPTDDAFEPPLKLKEPFDKTPFRPVKLPGWLEDVTTYVFGSAEDAVECKVQMGVIGIGDCQYVCYPSKLLPMSPAFKPDQLANEIKKFERAGMHLIAAIPPRLQAAMYAKHPEWRSKHTRDQVLPEIDPAKDIGGDLCLMGPWGDYLIDVLAEAMKMFPAIVGYSFDGIHDSGACYCDCCRAAYRKDTGKDIPDPNMNDPEFRQYEQWLNRRMEAFVVKLQTRLKAVNPDFALVTWTTNAGRFGHFLSIPRNMPARMNLLFDSPGQEYWLDETNRGNTVVPAFANAYIWAVTNHRQAHSEPYLMSHGNPYGTDSFPPHELYRRVLLTITHGAQMALARGWTNLREATRVAFEETNKRSPWLTHKKPEPWAAVVMSDDTNSLYGRDPGKVEERYLSNVLGAFRATLEEHLPTALICDWNLNPEDLAPYKVLVLPNTACLTEQQAESIRQYVKNGGGLVASVDVSLFDEFGNPRKEFLLSDVLGVRYKGTPNATGGGSDIDVNFAKGIVDPSYWEKRKNIFDFRISSGHEAVHCALLNQYVGQANVTFKGQAVAVEPFPKAEVVATIQPRQEGSQPLPAIVVSTYGKGKVVYMAAGFDSAYYLYPYPYQRLLITHAMRWAASEPPRITTDAPMCVHFTTFRQTKNGERLVVHLFNDLNTTGNHAKPDDDVSLREETIPVHDIKVRFQGYNISRVHLEPEGVDLVPVTVDGGIEVVVPKVEIHTMVVAELK